MLTLEDCFALTNLNQDEVAEIASHERLGYTAALEKGAALLEQPWGDAAVRQMVWDNLRTASHGGRAGRLHALAILYDRTCERHPGRCDRRRSPLRPTHPL